MSNPVPASDPKLPASTPKSGSGMAITTLILGIVAVV